MPTLDWLNKDAAVKAAANVSYRLLEPVQELGCGDVDNENMLIQGDNLEALKALIPLYAGRVKCIYIDPPYNTKSAFEHYDDNLEHSQWLSMIYPRLELLRELLAPDGSIWVSIDDNEVHYLKTIMDEIFGRKNFITTLIWQQRTTRENRKVFSNNHEYLLLYAKDPVLFGKVRNDLELNDEVLKRYKNPDNDPRGPWQSVSANAQAGHGTSDQFYTFVAPNGKAHELPKGRCWLYTEAKMQEEIAKNNIWFGKDGNGVPRIKKLLSEAKSGLTPETLWLATEVGTNDHAKKNLVKLFEEGELFETPKPEQLIQQVIEIATNKNEIVLDSFLGSGTTAAVAHKIERKYIGVEMGGHAVTHCQPRLKKVVDGEQGGISEAVNWSGGGGFRFFRLGETVFDEMGNINPSIRFPALASHVWYMATRTPLEKTPDSPLLGVYKGKAYYLLYNGILGDRKPNGGNVLTGPVLESLPPYDGPKVVFGEASRFGPARLAAEEIEFKQIPYEVRAL
ncbi:MAG: site-specific DNA-methyltransferase [Deltaproteobacteria bacterium]|nr:site-specific DNA-methyltransferase [Deltaproteobacteria bacterium]